MLVGIYARLWVFDFGNKRTVNGFTSSSSLPMPMPLPTDRPTTPPPTHHAHPTRRRRQPHRHRRIQQRKHDRRTPRGKPREETQSRRDVESACGVSSNSTGGPVGAPGTRRSGATTDWAVCGPAVRDCEPAAREDSFALDTTEWAVVIYVDPAIDERYPPCSS